MDLPTLQRMIDSGALYKRHEIGNADGSISLIYMSPSGGDAAYAVNGPMAYTPPSGWDSGGYLNPGGYSLSGPITAFRYIQSFGAEFAGPSQSFLGGLTVPLMASAGIAALAFTGFGAVGAIESSALAGEAAGMDAWLGTDIAVDVSASDSLASAVDISAGAGNVAASNAAEATSMFDDFGNIINADGTLSDPGGSWNLTDAEINAAADQAIASGSPISGMPTTYTTGTAALDASLNDIFSTVRNAVQTAGKLLNQGTAAIAQAQRNLNQAQPNYTAAAGSLNLGLLAAAVIAWKLM